MKPLDLAEHMAQHSMMGLNGQIKGITGVSFVDMANADYTMTAAESANSVIVVTNTGDGTKVLTIGDYPTTPARQTVLAYGSSPIGVAYDGEAAVAGAYGPCASQLVHIAGAGMFREGTQVVVARNAGGTTTAGNTNEQIIEQIVIPAAAWRDNETLTFRASLLKSNIATTETLRLRVGDQGNTTDVWVWENASTIATTAVAVSLSIMVQRINETTVAVVSAANNIAPFAASTLSTSFQGVTVDDMDANPVYISLTGTNSTGAETVTSKYLSGVLSS